MDERTRAATYRDVRRVAELLEAEHVEYALIGGYALALQGVVRLTEDLSWQDLAPYRTRIEGINVVSLAGLLRMKEHGRLKDQADAEAIRKALGTARE